jgi:hypothetical protein
MPFFERLVVGSRVADYLGSSPSIPGRKLTAYWVNVKSRLTTGAIQI